MVLCIFRRSLWALVNLFVAEIKFYAIIGFCFLAALLAFTFVVFIVRCKLNRNLEEFLKYRFGETLYNIY